MPCKSDHMAANALEIKVSRLLMMLDEVLRDIKVAPTSSGWFGYHPDVYTKPVRHSDADKYTRELCAALTEVPDVTIFTLEVQTWWRGHQALDARRARELNEEQLKAAKISEARAKLTSEELVLLGLTP